jgi:hypothetical protein
MAIYSSVPPPPELQGAATEQQPEQQQQQPTPSAIAVAPSGQIDIEAWTISALESLSVSPAVTGTTPLSIPLDQNVQSTTRKPTVRVQEPADNVITPPRRPPSRRDSMKRREALLKGKEGSRQRRRWENGRLTPCPELISL